MSDQTSGSLTNTDPKLEDIERQLTIATKWRELIDKLLPTGETKPLEGKVETDEKFGYVAQLVAHRALSELAGEVVEQLTRSEDEGLTENHRVLIVDKLEYAANELPLIEVESLYTYFGKVIQNQHESNKGILDTSREESHAELASALPLALAAVSAAPALMSTITDVASYFRTDYGITGQTFNLNSEGLVATVAGKLRTSKRIQVFLPDFQLIGDSKLLKRYVSLQEQALQLTIDKEQLRELVSAGKLEQADLDEANVALQSSSAVLTAFETFSKNITAQADGQHSLLAQAVVREKIRDLKITHLLWLGNLSSGGEAITENHLIRDDKISFWDGTAASFALAKADGGMIVAADTLAGLSLLRHNLSDNTNALQYMPFYGDSESAPKQQKVINSSPDDPD